MYALLQRASQRFYPCSVKTDGRSYRLQEEIVNHPGSASVVLPDLGVTFQHCHKYIGFLPNFHRTFPITPELVVPRKK